MAGTVYDSETEALDVVAEKLAAVSDLPNETLKLLGQKAKVVEEEAQRALPRTAQPALVRNFVIRNEAFFNLETFLSLLKSATKLAAGIVEFSTLAGVAGIADGVYDLYTLYRGIVVKGFTLSPDELAVVALLRNMGCATTKEILDRLQKPLEPEKIDKILEAFAVEREPTRGFILKDLRGRWRIEGV